MNKKITKKENLIAIGKLIENIEELTREEREQYLNFIEHEIELIDKKAIARGTTANQEENAKIAELIKDILSNSENALTITEIMEYDDIAEYRTIKGDKLSNQKISAIITQLKNKNEVIRIQDKKKAMFKLA